MINYSQKTKGPRFLKHLYLSEKLNMIRASVLGANDGIISVAGIVVGVAGANQNSFALFISGIAGMLAGALSMGGGEYVSVSTQRDTQINLVNKEKQLISENRKNENRILTDYYENMGLNNELSQMVATELMNKNALLSTVKAKYNFELKNYFSPWHAALSSFLSFICGSLLPLMAITLIPYPYKVTGTMFSVIIALSCTGYISSSLGNSNIYKGILRNLLVGLGTMLVTYFIGTLLA